MNRVEKRLIEALLDTQNEVNKLNCNLVGARSHSNMLEVHLEHERARPRFVERDINELARKVVQIVPVGTKPNIISAVHVLRMLGAFSLREAREAIAKAIPRCF